MTTNPPYGEEPAREAHLFGADSYDAAQHWAREQFDDPEWQTQQWAAQQFGDPDDPEWRGADMVSVSITRGADGRWQAHVYGWPARPPQPVRPDLDEIVTPDGDAVPAVRFRNGAGEWRDIDPDGPALDLGDVARMGRRPVPGQADLDAADDRTRIDLERFAGPPLVLDLDTEEPRMRKRRVLGRRGKGSARQQVVVERPADPAPTRHCWSTIEHNGARFTCKREHAPGTVRNLHQHSPGITWDDHDPRIVRTAD